MFLAGRFRWIEVEDISIIEWDEATLSLYVWRRRVESPVQFKMERAEAEDFFKELKMYSERIKCP